MHSEVGFGFENVKRPKRHPEPLPDPRDPDCTIDAIERLAGWRLLAAWTVAALVGWGCTALVVIALYDLAIWARATW